MDYKALIAKQRAEFDQVKPTDQDVFLGGEVVTVRLWPLAGPAWRELCARHPSRADAQFDQALGYDLTAVLADYPRVYLVDGDDVQNVGQDGSDLWGELCGVLSGPDMKNLEYVVWGINEYEPAQKLAAAGKASAGRKRKKRS